MKNDWRKIEAALDRIMRNRGCHMDRFSGTGDILAQPPRLSSTINITILAQDLAKELNEC